RAERRNSLRPADASKGAPRRSRAVNHTGRHPARAPGAEAAPPPSEGFAMTSAEAHRIMTAIVRADGCDSAVQVVPRPTSWGGPVLPVRGKRPLWKDWPARASQEVNGAFEWERATGVGLVTGERAGLFVLDVDDPKGGAETLAAWEREHGALPATWTSRTGGG